MSLIIVTQGVKEYRATIPIYVNKNDTVLEIGSAWGTTTNLLYKVAGKVVGIDKGESFHNAVEVYHWIEFHKVDSFDISKVLSLNHIFNKIYIDISGCRDILDIIKILIMYRGAYKPETIVIKSTRLKRLITECQTWDG